MTGDEIRRLTQDAEMDRIFEATGNLARLMWRYYTALRVEGFDEDTALDLTLDYQRDVFANARHHQ